jgi:hypothetical protein
MSEKRKALKANKDAKKAFVITNGLLFLQPATIHRFSLNSKS